MQNKCNNCEGGNGFVSLDGGWGSVSWSCGHCGCSNHGCDACSNCGWNRCGCNDGCGAVIYTNNRRNRSSDCDKDCQNGDSTRQNRSGDCACGNQTRSGNSGCNTCGTRSLYVECCDENTYIRDFSCGCSSNTRQGRSNGCDKCDESNGTTYTQGRSNGCDKCDECSGTTYTQGRTNGCSKCDECNGTSYTQGRTNGCSKCDDDNGTTYTQGRTNGCDKCSKCDDNGSTYTRSRKNRGVGMVWAAEQELDQIFESESALRAGTLFPELHKPMNGYCPGDCNCQTCEQEAAFAAWELRLYLNTHPDDKQALALFRKLCEETEDPNYATSFLKDMDCCSGWNWTDDPWPWECRPCGK